MQACGYRGTELGDWGFMPTHPAELKSELATRCLTLLGAFVPVDLSDPDAHAAGVEVALRTAKLLAAVEGHLPFIVLADENGKDPIRTQNAGRIKPEHGLSAEKWAIFAQGKMGHLRPGCKPNRYRRVPTDRVKDSFSPSLCRIRRNAD